jgi:RimK family alpha-L-glutamate ligase
MRQTKVVIFNDTHGWHSEQLCSALHRYGISTVCSDLATCSIDLNQPTGLVIPGLDGELPDAVIVRGIAPGSLEQITLRMDVLHTLSELGVPVFNSAKAIEHTVDKARTSLRLRLAGIPTPESWACESKLIARKIVSEQLALGKQLVVKPLFGCQGKGLEKISTLDQFEALKPVGDAFYIQTYIPPFEVGQWQDWRLMVIEGKVCAAMSRRSRHWITNFAQGADCFVATINQEMETIAIKATQAVEADYAGVDIIRLPNGHYSVLEVNSVPAWKGLTMATGIDVTAQLAKMIYQRVNALQTLSEHAHL